MPYRCLAEFLEALGHVGESTRIEDEVDPVLEVAEATARTAGSGGPALLFGSVKGHHLPVLTNLLGAEARICRALDVASLDEVSDRIARLFDPTGPEGWFERLKGGAQSAALNSMMPREVKSAACQQIVRLGSDIHLGELPWLQTGTLARSASEGGTNDGRTPDPSLALRASVSAIPVGAAVVLPHPQFPGGSATATPTSTVRSITATLFSAEPDSHRPVAGRFDLQRLDDTRLAVCWAAYDDHARLLGEYRARNQKMPLAVVIGGDPAFLLTALSPLPAGSDVCAVAGLLRERAIDVVACRSIDLMVPAEAEIVLEGFCDPSVPPVMAGPFCGPTGHCTLPQPAPVMQVTALAHRANPIFAAMIPGKPPHEAVTVARAMQRVFLPLAQLAMPELVDYDLPEFAAARHWAAVAIRKTYAGQGRRAAHAVWNLRPTMFAKVLVIVDENVDVHDHQQVLAAMAANIRPGRDIVIEQGPADPFDPAASLGGLSQKMAIDATRKLAGE